MTLGLLRPCLDCGEPSTESRCEAHRPAHARTRERAAPEERGYDSAWRRLSARAKRLQPFCLDCGQRKPLTVDHLPSAWWKKERRLPITLHDVEVVCGPCNTKRGSSRPGSDRYAEWEASR